MAGIHTWDVGEVFSNADGTIQFVEFVEANGGNGETGISGGSTSSDAKGFSWSGAPVSGTAFKRYLVGSQSFANLTGAPPIDGLMPTSVLPFFFSAGQRHGGFRGLRQLYVHGDPHQRHRLARLRHERQHSRELAGQLRRHTGLRDRRARERSARQLHERHAAELVQQRRAHEPGERRAGRRQRSLPAARRERRPALRGQRVPVGGQRDHRAGRTTSTSISTTPVRIP